MSAVTELVGFCFVFEHDAPTCLTVSDVAGLAFVLAVAGIAPYLLWIGTGYFRGAWGAHRGE